MSPKIYLQFAHNIRIELIVSNTPCVSDIRYPQAAVTIKNKIK